MRIYRPKYLRKNLLTKGLKNRTIRLGRTLPSFSRSKGKTQDSTLVKLLTKAKNTSFGRYHGFSEILNAEDVKKAYRERVPICDYDGMHPWWERAERGEEDVTWPGPVKYFALSSGTSGAPSKHIPVTREMIRSIRSASLKQLMVLRNFDVGTSVFRKKILTLSGSTTLQDFGNHFKGDVSGINVKHIPSLIAWRYHAPGKKISQTKEWENRLKLIVKRAPGWDVGIIAGVPAWLDILIDRLCEEYQLDNIHEMWPNLKAYIHGGVAFGPYREKLEKKFTKPVAFVETYLASEGFLALQRSAHAKGMGLITGNGVYFEFLPFNDNVFDPDGKLLDVHSPTLSLDEVELNTPYALVISTCAGAWRYMIGDVVRFVSLDPKEIIIDGRTKHFLSLCGEHLSVDNMTKAVTNVSHEMGISITEFAVTGYPWEERFAHHWYIGCNDQVDPEILRQKIDEELCRLNDDYPVERKHALKYMFLDVLPSQTFIEYLGYLGKAGGQTKFPRVLKGEQYRKWAEWLEKKGY